MNNILTVLVIIFLGACTAQPTLYELETEAMVTGDWTAFDRKNKRLLERAAYVDLVAECGTNNQMVWCETISSRIQIEDCWCARRW